MDTFEKDAHSKGFRFVAGVDEAGRGPLAGPVVAAAVIFSKLTPVNPAIKDSKTLTPQKRERIVYDIYRSALSVGVGISWTDEVDGINILRASLKAMEKAVSTLSVRPDFLLIDGNFPIDSEIEQRPIISGDALSISIAAASIIAKTVRDRIMEAYHRMYPDYNFGSHKGYATKEHLEMLRRVGPAPIHRKSFRGVLQDQGELF